MGIATHGKNTDRLSAEHLVGCCHSCGMGCNGGYPSAVWQWFKSNGVVTGGEYGNYSWCSSYSLKNVTIIVLVNMVLVLLVNILLPNALMNAIPKVLTRKNSLKISITSKVLTLSVLYPRFNRI